MVEIRIITFLFKTTSTQKMDTLLLSGFGTILLTLSWLNRSWNQEIQSNYIRTPSEGLILKKFIPATCSKYYKLNGLGYLRLSHLRTPSCTQGAEGKQLPQRSHGVREKFVLAAISGSCPTGGRSLNLVPPCLPYT